MWTCRPAAAGTGPAGDVGLIRSLTAGSRRRVSSQSCHLRAGPDLASLPVKGENTMPMLAELVEVVIGVDTHADTHSAAVLDVRTGGVLARVTVSTDPDGYTALVSLA